MVALLNGVVVVGVVSVRVRVELAQVGVCTQNCTFTERFRCMERDTGVYTHKTITYLRETLNCSIETKTARDFLCTLTRKAHALVCMLNNGGGCYCRV